MRTKGLSLKVSTCFERSIITIALVLMFGGCATASKTFDPSASGSQLIVEPENLHLGIAKIRSTQIVFKGKGFTPGDSVFVKLLNVEKKGNVFDIPIADGKVDQKGFFSAEVGLYAKITDLLRAEVGMNDKFESILIINQPPIPTGEYIARAESMESDNTAECKLHIKGPTFANKIVDWLGKVLGKIEKK